jgi:1-deoxy-D-xylulose 5-phosphate reductoisomerase
VGITELLTDVLEAWPGDEATDVDAVLDVDRRAREAAMTLVESRS